MGEEKQTYRIAAVVVTFNRLTLLQECIASLRNQTRKLDEIIVINNSSTDGTIEWLNDQKDLTVITQENSGSAGGQYTGIKTSYEKGCDWIWCMDDDAEPEVNALDELCKYIDNEKMILASVVLDEKKVIQLNHRGYFHLKKIKKGDLQYLSLLEDYHSKNFFLVDFASFVGVIINKKLIKEIGLPRKDFFICHDDVEYCLRANEVCKIYVIPASKIIHKEIMQNKIEIKKKFFWTSQRPLFNRYGIQCLCYRNMFSLYKNYSQNKVIGLINVFYNYLVLVRRIIIYDNYKYFRWLLLNKALSQALTGRFNNEIFLKKV